MKKKLLSIIEIILILIIAFICIVSIYNVESSNQNYKILILISDFLSNKTNFLISISLPFIFLIILELIKYNLESNRKELEYKMNIEVDNLEIIDGESNLNDIDEQTIDSKLEEINESKENLENTINIPFEEIQNQKKKNSEKEKNEDDTMILFTKDDIKEVIKKELKSRKE